MGAVNTTYTFTPTDTITSTKMNNIIDETVMTSQACLAGGGLEVASGQLTISQNAITPSRLAANAVTTDAIANGAVTPAKFFAGGPSWNSVTGTINISQPQVEVGTGITTSTASLIDFHSVHPLTDYDARIIRYSGSNGGMAIEQTGSGGISITSPNGVFLASANIPNPVGSAPIYGCRAWVSFDMTRDTSGTVTTANTNRFIYGSGNISSVQKTAIGEFLITFTVAMPNTNYAYSGSGRNNISSYAAVVVGQSSNSTTKTTTQIALECVRSSDAAELDFQEVNVMFIV